MATISFKQFSAGKPVSVVGNETSPSYQKSVVTPPTPATNGEIFKAPGSDYIMDTTKGVISDVADAGKSLTESKVGGARLETPIEALQGGLDKAKKISSAVVSPITRAVSPVLQPILEKVGDKINEIPGATDALNKANDLIDQYPESAKAIGDLFTTFMNATMLVGAPKVAPIVSKEVSAVASDVSTLAGKAKEAVAPVVESITSKVKGEIPTPRTVDEIVGQIIQGAPEDIASGKKALTEIDPTNIKTQEDLYRALDKRVEDLDASKQSALSASPVHNNPLKLGDWEQTIKVGKDTVRHNYVEDGLNQLKDYYTKTNDVANATRIKNLMQKAETDGLTINEVDTIAKEHGQKLNAFNASGELASGLTKQSAENTRSGIKATAREVFGDKTYAAIDSAISDTIKTRDLIKDQVDAVNKLEQKIKERTVGEKVGRLLGEAINLFGMNSPKGLVEYFLGRGSGLKTLNALDLQQMLSKNLKALKELTEKKLTEKQMEKKLQSIIDDNQSLANQAPTEGINTPSTITKSPSAQQNTPNKNIANAADSMNPIKPSMNDIETNSTTFTPESKTFQAVMDYLKDPKLGLSTKAVKISPVELDSAIFDHLAELTKTVEGSTAKGKMNLDDLQLLEDLGRQKPGDLSGADRQAIYEMAARYKRQDIVQSITDMVMKNEAK